MRLLEHPNSRNLGGRDDGATEMLITLSVLVQMGLMRAHLKGNADGFQIEYAFFISTF